VFCVPNDQEDAKIDHVPDNVERHDHEQEPPGRPSGSSEKPVRGGISAKASGEDLTEDGPTQDLQRQFGGMGRGPPDRDRWVPGPDFLDAYNCFSEGRRDHQALRK